MPALNIEGKTVQVGDDFLKLTPEQQNSTVEEIAKSMKIAPAADAGEVAPKAFDASDPRSVGRSSEKALEGVPVLGAYVPQAGAMVSALANPLTGVGSGGSTIGERYRKNLQQEKAASAAAEIEHPVESTLAKTAGGILSTAPLMAAAPAAFGLTGTLLQMVARGAASNAALNAADAAARGEDIAKGAEFGGVVGGALPLAGRAVGKLIGGVRNMARPSAPVAQNVEQVGSTSIPLTQGQAFSDPLKQAEEEIMRRGGRGGSAEAVARQADEAAQQQIQAASSEIGASLDPSAQSARTAPQNAGQVVQSELTAQQQAANAAELQRTLAVAQQGNRFARGLGGGAAPVAAFDAAESIGAGVTARRDAATARTKAAYQARDEVAGTFDESVPRTLSEEIRTRVNAGDDPLWVDPTNESTANKALKLIDQTVGSESNIFRNRAAPPAAAEATPGGGEPGWQERAQKLADDMIAQGINPTKARAAAAASEGGPLAPHDVAVPGGGSVSVVPKVVEASSLKTSADSGYDAALQPRNRARAASDAQIKDIASNLNPSRLGVSSEVDRGAPIVGADSMVESGNGRMLALRRAYQENGPAAQKYRQWLADQGVDVSKFKEPVLVRERSTPMSPEERKAFTVAANHSATLSLSAPERALADARSISGDSLGLIRNPGDLGAVENRDFVRQFVSKLPQTEQGAMTTASGDLSSEGLARVRNAVLAKAYGDTPILSRVAESTKDDVKSISNALTSSAPEWAAMRAAAERGDIPKDLDITQELLDAVGRTAKIRAKGTSLESSMAQRDAFGAQSPESERLMRMFYDADGKSAASSSKIADGLRHYAQEALKVDASPGLGLGLAPTSAKDILDVSVKRVGAPGAVAPEVAEKATAPAAEAIVEAAEKAPVVDLKTMDNARKRLVRMYTDAKNVAARSGDASDQRAMARILHEFDNVISDAMLSGKFSGDVAMAKSLQEAARASHAEYKTLFSSKPGDEIGRSIEKILGRYHDTAATPDEIAALSYGAGSEPGGGKAVKVAGRLRQILGDTSPEWGQYKQGLFSKLTQSEPGEAQRTAAEVADRIDRFLGGTRGRGLANIVYSPAERAQLAAYSRDLRATTPRGAPVTDVEKAVARIAGTDGHLPASPGEVVDMLYSRTGKGDKGISVRLAQHLKQNLTPDGWTSVRQGMWEKLVNAGEGKVEYGPQALSQRLHEFLNESGKGLATVLFSAPERAQMAQLAAVYKKMIQMKGTTNPSGTAPVLAKIANKASGNILALIGLGAHGVTGAIAGHGIQKIGSAVRDARAGKEATRLFFGPQAKAATRDSRLPVLVGASGIPAARR